MNITIEEMTDWLNHKFIPVYLHVKYNNPFIRHDWGSVIIKKIDLVEIDAHFKASVIHISFKFQVWGISKLNSLQVKQYFDVDASIPFVWYGLDQEALLRQYCLHVLGLNLNQIYQEQITIMMASQSIDRLNDQNIQIQSILTKGI